MKENKPKVEKIRKPRQKLNMSSMLFVGISLFLTIGLFIGLVILQSALMEEITYKQIVVAKTDIPKNTIVTEENAATYFTHKEINILDVTNGSMQTIDELIGQKAIVPLYTGEAVTAKDFENLNTYTEGFNEPVEISIKVADIADADGGKLRAGDIVNLTMMFTREQLGMEKNFSGSTSLMTGVTDTSSSLMKPVETQTKESEQPAEEVNTEAGEAGEEAGTPATEEKPQNVVPLQETKTEPEKEDDGTGVVYEYDSWAQYVMENIYVTKVLDSAGVEIDPTDTELSASIIVFVIEKDDEKALNNALANGSSLRLSKMVTKPEEAFVDIDVEIPTEEIPEETEAGMFEAVEAE